jgi:hypothetical protein
MPTIGAITHSRLVLEPKLAYLFSLGGSKTWVSLCLPA